MQANREFVAELQGHEARINGVIKGLNLRRDKCAKAVAPIVVLRARAEAQLQRLIEAARCAEDAHTLLLKAVIDQAEGN